MRARFQEGVVQRRREFDDDAAHRIMAVRGAIDQRARTRNVFIADKVLSAMNALF